MRREFAFPGTRPRYARDRTFDVRHIRLDLDLDVPGRSVSGTCSITLSPLSAELRRVVLDSVELKIESVTRDGKPLEHSADGRHLEINLGSSPKVGDELVLDIAYSATPRRGLYFVGPDEGYPDKPQQVWSQGQDEDSRYWFPCFDSPHEKFTSELLVRVPKNWFALSNGVLISDEITGDQRALHWRLDHQHAAYLTTLVAGDFCEIRDEWDGIEVTYYGEPSRAEDVRRSLGRTPEMLELFSRLFGARYPYEKYAQVFVTDFIFGGMENTTATTLTDMFILDERAALDHDVEFLVAHELAHQWFGDLVTCRSWSEGWLNEGFATYSEYLWREHSEGRDTAALDLVRWGEAYFSEDSRRYRRPIVTNTYYAPIDVFDHHLYEKGGRVLHMLRCELGDEAFWSAVRHYLCKHRHSGMVETRDLARAIEEATGRVLDWFFDQWIAKSGHPELSVSYSWDSENELACVTVQQTQSVDDSTPLFRIPTTMRFQVGEKTVDCPIEITEKQHTFYCKVGKVDAPPSQAIFDPGKSLLGHVKTDKPLPMWVAELRSASEAIDRIDAARFLGSHCEVSATEALIEALKTDPFWGVQAAAAAALGEMRTDAARDALITALKETKHPRARRAVARALGDFRRDETAAEALADVVRSGDESYFVEAEACTALGRTRSPIAAEVLRSALNRDSYLDIIRQCVYRGLAEARDDSALPLLLEATAYGKVAHGRRAALLALAELAVGRTDRLASDARDRIEECLTDRSFLVQVSAIEAVAILNDSKSIPALSRMSQRELDARLRRRAREVIRDLEEGRVQAEQISTLRDTVDGYRKELAALKETVERLENAGKSGNGRTPVRKTSATKQRRTGGKKSIRAD